MKKEQITSVKLSSFGLAGGETQQHGLIVRMLSSVGTVAMQC